MTETFSYNCGHIGTVKLDHTILDGDDRANIIDEISSGECPNCEKRRKERREKMLQEKEAKALDTVSTKCKCLKRLRDGLSCLDLSTIRLLGAYTFDFENKRLVSPCKRYTLQWKLRLKPNEPESPKNQQCTVGITIFEVLS